MSVMFFVTTAKATRVISHPFDGKREVAPSTTTVSLLNCEGPSVDIRVDDSNEPRRKYSEEQERAEERIRVISGNIHSMRPRAEVIATWEADIIALQETKLAPHAISQTAAVVSSEGWQLKHGKPCQAPQRKKAANNQATVAANEANSSGVAVMARQPMRIIHEEVNNHDQILHD